MARWIDCGGARTSKKSLPPNAQNRGKRLHYFEKGADICPVLSFKLPDFFTAGNGTYPPRTHLFSDFESP